MNYPEGPLTRKEKLQFIQEKLNDLILEDAHEKLMIFLDTKNLSTATIVVHKDLYASEFNDEVYLNKVGIKLKNDVLDINLLLENAGVEQLDEQSFFKILKHNFEIHKDMPVEVFKNSAINSISKKSKFNNS